MTTKDVLIKTIKERGKRIILPGNPNNIPENPILHGIDENIFRNKYSVIVLNTSKNIINPKNLFGPISFSTLDRAYKANIFTAKWLILVCTKLL